MTRLEIAQKRWEPYAAHDAAFLKWKARPWYVRWLFRRPVGSYGRCAAWEEKYLAERGMQ